MPGGQAAGSTGTGGGNWLVNRYRARSGAALAAATFAVFLATVICLVGSGRTANPLQRPGGQPEQAAE